MEKSTISTYDLKVVFSKIINKLEYENKDEMEFQTDFYWYIPANTWDTFEQSPANLGSLKDDAKSLALLANDPERMCTYVDFDRVAAILIAISQKNNPI